MNCNFDMLDVTQDKGVLAKHDVFIVYLARWLRMSNNESEVVR
jgi:hypothetical protein